jgi:pimeloyl-ACP methyl ester carboxylesterase
MISPRQVFVDCPHAEGQSGGTRRMAYWLWQDPQCAHPERVVVCVHGLTRQGRDFDVLARALAPQVTVVCPDVAGRGGSDWLADPLQYHVGTYVQDMVAMLAQLGARDVAWVGTSMGGLIGMAMAALPASPIRRLVLNDVGPAITKASLLRIAEYVGKAPAFDSVQAGADYMRVLAPGFGPHTPEQWLALSAPMLKPQGDQWIMHYDPAIAAPLAMLQLEQADELLAQGEAAAWATYDAIGATTLVLRGEQSDLLTPETVQAMALRGPRASSVTIEGVGHAPTIVADDQVALVQRFVLGD